MKTSIGILAVLLILIAMCAPASGAGLIGHFIVGTIAQQRMLSGQASCPPELKEALQTPDGQKAFAGGAIGPDLCEKQSHYGNTGDMARKMISDAQAELKAAKASGDSDAMAAAYKDVAFSYGWLSHCATDLDVHPAVNAVIGDTYR
jgi:hypothetical protein